MPLLPRLPDAEFETLWRARIGEALWAKLRLALAGTGTHTPADIMRGVLAGRYQLHEDDAGAPGACAVSEVVTYPRCVAVHCFLAFGDLSLAGPVRASLERLAREVGADRITVHGRLGWGRVGSRSGGAAADGFRSVYAMHTFLLGDEDTEIEEKI